MKSQNAFSSCSRNCWSCFVVVLGGQWKRPVAWSRRGKTWIKPRKQGGREGWVEETKHYAAFLTKMYTWNNLDPLAFELEISDPRLSMNHVGGGFWAVGDGLIHVASLNRKFCANVHWNECAGTSLQAQMFLETCCASYKRYFRHKQSFLNKMKLALLWKENWLEKKSCNRDILCLQEHDMSTQLQTGTQTSQANFLTIQQRTEHGGWIRPLWPPGSESVAEKKELVPKQSPDIHLSGDFTEEMTSGRCLFRLH